MTQSVGFLLAILTCACAFQSKPRLSYEGHSTVVSTSPAVVRATVTVRNNGSKTAQLVRPICPIPIVVHPTPERDTEPLWKSAEERCFIAMGPYPRILIGPRDYFEFSTQATLPTELLGKQLFLSIWLPFPDVLPVPTGQLWISK